MMVGLNREAAQSILGRCPGAAHLFGALCPGATGRAADCVRVVAPQGDSKSTPSGLRPASFQIACRSCR